MKKILIATNILFMGIIYFQSCNPVEKPDTGVKSDNPTHKNCDTCDKFPGSEVSGLIRGSTAKILFDNYGADNEKTFIWDRHQLRDSLDARRVWFDIKSLKRFL